MQKIKDFCKRHRLLWLTLLVALAAAPGGARARVRHRCGRVGRV